MFVDEIYVGTIPNLHALGDAIVWNPIIHKYAEQCNTLYYASSKHNFETLTCLYQDYKNIVVLEGKEYEEKRQATQQYGAWDPSYMHLKWVPLNALNISFFLCNTNWERQTYEHFDLPYSVRYTGFKLPKHIEGSKELYEKLTDGCTDYAVVNRYIGHFHERIPYNIDHITKGLKVIEITPFMTKNMLQFMDLFRNAKQIHTPGTSTFCLLETLKNELSAELYFHNVRRNYVSFIDYKRWVTVTYDEQFRTDM